MQITVISAGSVKEDYLLDGINIFIDRLNHYCRLEIVEVADEKIPGGASNAEIEQLKDKEGERIIDKIPERSYVFAMDVKGKPMTSKGFAKSIRNLQVRGYSHLSFIIGGALGLSKSVINKADYRLSMSHMTFTHQMIRLILLEQIYRAFRINNGEPYHL